MLYGMRVFHADFVTPENGWSDPTAQNMLGHGKVVKRGSK